MSTKKTVEGRLNIEILVDCPGCGKLVDILDRADTNNVGLDDEGEVLEQVWPSDGTNIETFECEEVTCTKCKTEFTVKGLEW